MHAIKHMAYKPKCELLQLDMPTSVWYVPMFGLLASQPLLLQCEACELELLQCKVSLWLRCLLQTA